MKKFKSFIKEFVNLSTISFPNDTFSAEDKIEADEFLLAMFFLNYVENMMEQKSISKKDLAKMANTSHGHITQMMRGDRIHSLKMLAKMLQAVK